MTQEIIERTVREWTAGDAQRAARELSRLTGKARPGSVDEMVEALIRLAGRLEVANTRAW